jgi:hypothetical protein
MKQGLFLIQSPLQVIETYEAINFFRITNPSLIIRENDNRNNNFQIQLLLKLFNLEDFVIKRFFLPSFNGRKLSYFINLVKFSVFFLKKRKQISLDYIFLPEYSSGFTQFLYNFFLKGNTNIFLLDDGVATIYTYYKQFSSDFFLNLFTLFDFLVPYEYQIIIKHQFEYLKRFIFSERKYLKFKEDTIVIIGQPLYEKNIISFKENLYLIESIKNIFKNKELIYIPHRSESKEKITRIAYIKDLKIKRIFYPIELFGYFEGYIPSYFVSFISTALFTLKQIYKSKNIAIKLKNDILPQNKRKNIELIYEILQRYYKIPCLSL